MAIKRVSNIDDDGVIVNVKDYSYTIYNSDQGYLFRNKKHNIKMYQDVQLSSIISNKADYANMHLLAEQLYKDTNMICYKRNRKYYPADIDDIAQILQVNLRTTKDFISRMMQLGIIAKVIINTKESIQVQYHVNPIYFNTSKYLSPALYMLFRKQLDKHLPDWVIRKFNEV